MTKIKICGLSRAADIEAVNHAMPDYIGFVFAESPRRVDATLAAGLRKKLDKSIQAVGVFVDENPGVIAELHRRGVIDIAQLHGGEDEAYIARLRTLCECPIIKAVRVGSELPHLPRGADYLLFDSGAGGGKTFDWRVLDCYAGPPYFLAGGLSETNVATACDRLQPYCVDVSSGVETGGVKDFEKIARFVNLVRGNL